MAALRELNAFVSAIGKRPLSAPVCPAIDDEWFRPMLEQSKLVGVWTAVGALLSAFNPHECANYFANAGYGRSRKSALAELTVARFARTRSGRQMLVNALGA